MLVPTSNMFKVPCVILLCISLLITGSRGDCSVPGNFDYAMPAPLDKDSFPIGSTVSYVCRTGYIRVPGTKNTVTCLDGDTWSVPDIFCRRKLCGNPGETPNGEFEADDFLFGSRVTYKCYDGYRLSSRRNYRDCQADGTWSNTVPVCEAVVCPAPEKPDKGGYDPQKDEYSNLDSVTFTCNGGLYIFGESSASCTTNGTWSSATPECIEVNCPNPNVPNSRRLSGFVGPYKMSSAVSFECAGGYAMNGSSSITCRINSQWEPEVPQCLTFCSSPPPTLSFAVLDAKFTSISYYFSGTSVKYNCKEGFIHDPNKGNTTITCSDSKWASSDQFCSRRSCGSPGEMANTTMKVPDFLFGSSATYTCLEGHAKKSGISYKVCQANGNWSSADLVCEAVSCGDPGEIANANKLVPNFLFGARVYYTCIKGYIMQNEIQYRECQADGKWSTADLVCTAVCDRPPTHENAELHEQYVGKDHHFINTTVMYICKKGYELQSSAKEIQIKCLGKSWSSTKEICSQKSNVPIIVGITIAIAVVCCVGLLIWYLKKQKKSRKPVSSTPDVRYSNCNA